MWRLSALLTSYGKEFHTQGAAARTDLIPHDVKVFGTSKDLKVMLNEVHINVPLHYYTALKKKALQSTVKDISNELYENWNELWLKEVNHTT